MRILQVIWGAINTGYAAFFAVAVAVFVALAKLLPLDNLIVLLNGAFIGTMIAVSVAYGRLYYDAYRDNTRFGRTMPDDVRRMVLSLLGGWLAYGIVVGSSFYVRAADEAHTSMIATALSRYIAVLAAIGQVTAPSFGERVFATHDSRVLWIAVSAGVVSAAVSIYLQQVQALATYGGALWFG